MISTKRTIDKNEFIDKLKENIYFDVQDKILNLFHKGHVAISKRHLADILSEPYSSFYEKIDFLGFDKGKKLDRNQIIKVLNVYNINIFEK